MSIMMNGCMGVKDYRPVVPSWYKQERYDYCERFAANAGSAKRSIFTRRADKKRNK